VSERYAFIDVEKARYPIVKMCVWLDVSASGYYEWVDRAPSACTDPKPRCRSVRCCFGEWVRPLGGIR
jgi:putative transposase